MTFASLRAAACAMALCAGLLFAGSSAAEPELGDDGLHKQPYFEQTFRDLAEDLAAAEDAGKRLAIIFEQRGCIYCAKLHKDVLSDPDVAAYIEENFVVVQYNLFGDEEVIDFDGATYTEKTAGAAWGVLYTPTILFFGEAAPESGGAASAVVSRMPGAFGKGTVLDMFEWVRVKGYDGDEHFQKFHARRIAERKAAQ